MSYYLYIHDFLQLTRKQDLHKTQHELIVINCDDTLDNCSMYIRSLNM